MSETPPRASLFGDEQADIEDPTSLLSGLVLSLEDLTALVDALPRAFEFAAEPAAGDNEVRPSDELAAVSRRIAGQYVEVVAGFAASAFAGDLGRVELDRFLAALDSLNRLALAADDQPQLAVIAEMRSLVEEQSERLSKGRGRTRFTAALEEWIPRFSSHLDEEDRDRLMRLVSFQGQDLPLLDALGQIPGIGPRRLTRLYCAGLYTVASVSQADPTELAQVTGMPNRLATEVVETARRFAAEHPKRCIAEIQARVRDLVRLRDQLSRDPEVGRTLNELLNNISKLTHTLSAGVGEPS